MNCDHSTNVRHLNSMGEVQKSGVWVPHSLSQNHKHQLMAIYASLLDGHWLAREEHRPFLFCIITGDEKLCLYPNIRERKEWLSPNKKATPRTKTCAHPQKMLCISWNSDELLPRGVTMTADIYCQQLKCLAGTIQEKRPTKLREAMLLHDNARPHSANLRETLYRSWVGKLFRIHFKSPDLAPPDFHLFRSPSNDLQGTSFSDENVLRTWFDDFFNSNPRDFHSRGIEKLLQHWQTVVNSEGEYIVDWLTSLLCVSDVFNKLMENRYGIMHQPNRL